MSFIKCQGCGGFINSDNDPDCFVEVGDMKRQHKEIVLCEPCRDEHFEEEAEKAGAGP